MNFELDQYYDSFFTYEDSDVFSVVDFLTNQNSSEEKYESSEYESSEYDSEEERIREENYRLTNPDYTWDHGYSDDEYENYAEYYEFLILCVGCKNIEDDCTCRSFMHPHEFCDECKQLETRCVCDKLEDKNETFLKYVSILFCTSPSVCGICKCFTNYCICPFNEPDDAAMEYVSTLFCASPCVCGICKRFTNYCICKEPDDTALECVSELFL